MPARHEPPTTETASAYAEAVAEGDVTVRQLIDDCGGVGLVVIEAVRANLQVRARDLRDELARVESRVALTTTLVDALKSEA